MKKLTSQIKNCLKKYVQTVILIAVALHDNSTLQNTLKRNILTSICIIATKKRVAKLKLSIIKISKVERWNIENFRHHTSKVTHKLPQKTHSIHPHYQNRKRKYERFFSLLFYFFFFFYTKRY